MVITATMATWAPTIAASGVNTSRLRRAVPIIVNDGRRAVAVPGTEGRVADATAATATTSAAIMTGPASSGMPSQRASLAAGAINAGPATAPTVPPQTIVD